MFAGDSLFTLTPVGIAGLLALSLALLSVMVWLATRISGHWVMRVLFALLMLVLFMWLSPQIYYQYYRLIFEGLPQQLVVGNFPHQRDILQILTFRSAHTLSAYSQGILGWALIAAAAIRRKG